MIIVGELLNGVHDDSVLSSMNPSDDVLSRPDEGFIS